MTQDRYVIDDPMYGITCEFGSLEAAQTAMRECGFVGTEFCLVDCGAIIMDETGARVGYVIEGTN